MKETALDILSIFVIVAMFTAALWFGITNY